MKAIGAAAFLLLFVGCGASTPRTGQIAIPGPLQEVSVGGVPTTGPAGFRMVEAEGKPSMKVVAPMVVGSQGEGLNIATSVYRTLQAMGIQTEVRCCYPETSHTRLEIVFPEGLSPTQRGHVERVLTLIFGPGSVETARVSRR
jgi:hypothetical protein